jgi:hypothetical protein
VAAVTDRFAWVRRLAVEFGVIVVGVLVALLAESWWQERGERADEVATLQRIDGELAADSAYLDLYGDWLRIVQPGFEEARDAVNGSSTLGSSASLAMVYASATEVMGRRPISTWDELLASGRLADMEDPDLRQALVGYYSDFDDLVENGLSLPADYRVAVTAGIPVPVTTRILAECIRKDIPDASTEAAGPREDVERALRSCTAVEPREAERLLGTLRLRPGLREALEARAYQVEFVAERHRRVLLHFDSLRMHLHRVLGR